jgi:adenylate kinase
MKLIIFGPPGSGKGTYSQRLAAKYNIAKISTGDIFRDEIKRGTELGKKVEYIIKAGQLVPDELVNKILEERINSPDAKNGFILDGYPRTVYQAEFLSKIANIDAIIEIIAPKEILIEKISARRICSNTKCDGNYNIADIHKVIDGIKYDLPPLLPKKEGICDKCGSPLYQRDDDKPEVVEKRLAVYEEQSKPVLEYYKKTKIPFITVYMNKPPELIIEEISEKIEKLNLK